MKKIIIVALLFAGACKFSDKKEGPTGINSEDENPILIRKGEHSITIPQLIDSNKNTGPRVIDTNILVFPGNVVDTILTRKPGIRDRRRLRDGFVVPKPTTDSIAMQ